MLFLEASGGYEKTDNTQVAMLLSCIGDEGLDLYNTFAFTEEEDKSKQKLQIILDKFEAHCAPKKNIVFERFVFNNINQKEGQAFDSFLTELRKAVKSCEYPQEESMIRDRVVVGISDKNTQERLLREPKLDLQKAIEFCKAVETSRGHAQAMQAAEQSVSSLRMGQKGNDNKHCRKCGYSHVWNKCPAFRKVCAKCQGKNHFAKMCQKGESAPKKAERKRVDDVTEAEEPGDDNSDVYVDAISELGSISAIKKGASKSGSWWSKKIKVNSKWINFKLDTGAETNVLPKDSLDIVDPAIPLKRCKTTLLAYGNFKLKPLGFVELLCEADDRDPVYIKFMVIDVKSQLPLLGLQACLDLNLIQRVDTVTANNFSNLDSVVKQYESLFTGLGKFPTKHKIVLKEDAVPHIQPMQRIPRSLFERLKNKLTEMELQGIIRKVDKPTEWLNAVVIVEKRNGDIRLCLDPKYLNLVIKREHFMIPTVDDITSQLANKEFFTVLDMKDGYYQVAIDDASSDLCTFSTPFGRFQFVRLPFGISSAPEVFQKKNYEIFGDIDGVEVYFDDLIISGVDEVDHDKTLVVLVSI